MKLECHSNIWKTRLKKNIKITWIKNRYYKIIKESIQQECITILIVNEPNNRTFRFMKQKLIELKGENNKSRIIEQVERKSELTFIEDAPPKKNKRLDILLNFTKTDLSFKLNKFDRIEIIQSIFSNHNGIKLETNHRNISAKSSNIWKWNITFLNIYKWKRNSQDNCISLLRLL